jgi:hypothetical protein
MASQVAQCVEKTVTQCEWSNLIRATIAGIMVANPNRATSAGLANRCWTALETSLGQRHAVIGHDPHRFPCALNGNRYAVASGLRAFDWTECGKIIECRNFKQPGIVTQYDSIPGVGPLLASAIVATVPDPAIFRSGRNLAAWIGLVPRQNSSGGKERLGGITKAGHQYLRQMLIVGAMAVVRYAERNGAKRPWLVQLLARRKPKVAAVALANKNARMIWALMTSGERYREPQIA